MNIEATYKARDELVYGLYKLTGEDIKRVEGILILCDGKKQQHKNIEC